MTYFSSNPIQALLEFLGALTVLASGVKAIAYFLSPYKDTKKKIDEHEKRLNEHDRYFKNDKEQLELLTAITKESLKLQLSMANHTIDGNGIEKMKEVRQEIQNKIFDI